MISKVYLEKLRLPISVGYPDPKEKEYKYDVRIVRSVDGGETFWYCGCGSFCQTLDEAKSYIVTNPEKFSEVIFVENGNVIRRCPVSEISGEIQKGEKVELRAQ